MSAKAAKLPPPMDAAELSALDAILKRRIEEALADPAPSIPQEEVFANLKALHEKRRG